MKIFPTFLVLCSTVLVTIASNDGHDYMERLAEKEGADPDNSVLAKKSKKKSKKGKKSKKKDKKGKKQKKKGKEKKPKKKNGKEKKPNKKKPKPTTKPTPKPTTKPTKKPTTKPTKSPTNSPTPDPKTNKPTSNNLNVLVSFKSRNGAMLAMSDDDVTINNEVGGTNIVGMTTNPEKVNSYKNDPFVEFVETDHQMTIPPYAEENNLVSILATESTPWGIPEVLQDVNFWNNEDVNGPKKICVVDTGFDKEHEDLPRDYVTGTEGVNEDWNFDGNGHGSHTAGTVAAVGGNGKGVVGVIPNSKGGKFHLMIGKGLNANGLGSASSVMRAVQSCVDNGADVISLSLGCNNCKTQTEQKYYKKLYKNKNILIVAAAGNSGDAARAYPSSYPHVVSVASLMSNGDRSDFSQFNSQVEISGPGHAVKSTFKGNGYKTFSGTSMACPHVAAVATLLWMHFPSCKNYQIRNALDETASGTQCNEYTGFGMVRAKDAYDLLSKGDCAQGVGSKDGVGGCDQLDAPAVPIAQPTKSPTTSQPDLTPEPTYTPTGTEYPTDTSNSLISLTYTPTASQSSFGSFSCDEFSAQVVIRTDTYPEDTSFTIKDEFNNTIIKGDRLNIPNHLYTFNKCLPKGCYVFTIDDKYGDGICCGWGLGIYQLYFDGQEQMNGGDFEYEDSFNFGHCCYSTEVSIRTDTHPEENSFIVTNSLGEVAMESVNMTKMDFLYTFEECLPEDCYVFTIKDTHGDGICCAEDQYQLYYNGEEQKTAGYFLTEDVVSFGACEPKNECVDVQVLITTDTYPEDTSFIVTDDSDVVVMEGEKYKKVNKTYSQTRCLSDGCYLFAINDSHGDGICCGWGEGKYQLFYNGEEQRSGGEFEVDDNAYFGNCGSKVDCIPVKVSIMTDDSPEEISFLVTNSLGEVVMEEDSMKNRNERYNFEKCLIDDCYQFTIRDTYGDGICCEWGKGQYQLYYNGEEKRAGGVFAEEKITYFGNCDANYYYDDYDDVYDDECYQGTCPPNMKIILGKCCLNIVEIGDGCIPDEPHFDPEGVACGGNNEGYCSYDVGPNTCAYCEDDYAVDISCDEGDSIIYDRCCPNYGDDYSYDDQNIAT